MIVCVGEIDDDHRKTGQPSKRNPTAGGTKNIRRGTNIAGAPPPYFCLGLPPPSAMVFVWTPPPAPRLHRWCCGMVKSHVDLAPFSAALGSKQQAFVPAAVVRRRVRQRESSSTLQHAPAAAARPQLLTATTDYHGGANGAATIRERLTVGSVRVSSGSSNNGSGGNEVYTSRNRMMAAAKRRRWTEASRAPCTEICLSAVLQCISEHFI